MIVVTAEELRDAAERNFVETWWFMATTDTETEAFAEDGVRAFITGDPSPLMNAVIATRIVGSSDDVDAAIDRTIARFRARRAPILWWRLPSAEPADLADRLAARGFVAGDEMPAMAMDLVDLPARPAIPGLTIERVRDADGIETFLALAGPILAAPAAFTAAARRIFNADGFGESSVGRHYIGRLNGRTVATCSLMLVAGVAGIYNVATVEDVRGRGIGTALTVAPLDEAKPLGYRIAALQSSTAGHGVYQRIGFRDVAGFGVHILS